jgi:hypothetical protein
MVSITTLKGSVDVIIINRTTAIPNPKEIGIPINNEIKKGMINHPINP